MLINKESKSIWGKTASSVILNGRKKGAKTASRSFRVRSAGQRSVYFHLSLRGYQLHKAGGFTVAGLTLTRKRTIQKEREVYWNGTLPAFCLRVSNNMLDAAGFFKRDTKVPKLCVVITVTDLKSSKWRPSGSYVPAFVALGLFKDECDINFPSEHKHNMKWMVMLFHIFCCHCHCTLMRHNIMTV